MRREIIVDNEIQVILDKIRYHYRRRAKIALYKLLQNTHPAVLSDAFRHLSEIERSDIFQYIQRMSILKDFLPELDDMIIEELFEDKKPDDVAQIIHNLPAEDMVDILALLPQRLSEQIQENLDKEELEEVQELFQYPEESAGRIMSTQFVTFEETFSVRKAIDRFQDMDEDTEAPFYIYVVDQSGRMVGVLSLRHLLLYPRSTILQDIMEKNFIAVSPETDQEEVADIVSQYNYLAIPVLEKDNELVGVITVDDVIDIIREEATEDILKMAGAGDDREILHKSTLESARIRFPWLMASWLGGVLALTIIGVFESLLEKTIVLAAFIPIIMGMGGNVGTQTSTIVVRGIATDRINLNYVSSVIFKEIRVGMLLGAIYGFLLGILAYYRYLDFQDPAMLGVVVGTAVFSAMAIASTIGVILPIFLNKLKIDPAIATGPIVTTSVDIFGVIIYFYIASILIKI
ncbi:MAG: magnesium transporter [Candidatus Marinimicrobia bacterium]|jgi:magnesium transporter|nr:magnesium transporter [Candidatus Neomarinimicrobiota bacterium]MBT3633058.1 magnesium transporter [Candidatus Neomarinimicrobiota bacterium]MBT3683500.1 magnesium transporter [Candidatus Neomarinimicrobiota bacterium]MBT3758658.1 magnesium transporter [Candidatus Neomarinimicrobiota bacterium]MBT3896433.1 magnesium transporter [Candidatus Neomarinimicrobiota bacterium]